MTITTPTAFTLDTDNFVRGTFIVSLGSSYSTYASALTEALKSETSGTASSPALDPNIAAIINGQTGDNGPTPAYFSKRKCRDTTMGGNDAINCYPQFNEDDDVVHPFTSSCDSMNGIGEGRAYSEAFDDNQQIMYLSFGVAMYNTLSAFYNNAVNMDLAMLMNNGQGISFEKIGYIAGVVVGSAFAIPMIPLYFLSRIVQGMSGAPITKYYDFKSQMPLYYRFVQSILINIGTNMGMMDDPSVTETGASPTAGAAGTPDFIKTFQFDIYRVLLRRYQYEAGGAGIKMVSSDGALQATMNAGMSQASTAASGAQSAANSSQDASSGDGSSTLPTIDDRTFDAFFDAYKATLYDANLFIGFKVERGVDTSESLNNTTGQSSVEQMINSKIQSMRETRFGTMNGQVGDNAIFNMLGKLVDGIQAAATGVGDVLGLSGISALATGAGIVDIPEEWKDSSFNKSYSFEVKLRSPYGDPFSIIQRIYVPLACLLAGSLPRATGPSSYTSPFLVRAYCRGMFAVPLGIIDSITIHRGDDQFGWSISRLPTAINVSFTIKDLSPAMYMAMGGTGSMLSDIFGADSSFSEYLMTLSGMGLQDRIFAYKNIKRRFTILMRSIFDNRLNPVALGMTIAQRSPMRFITNIIPSTKLTPKN